MRIMANRVDIILLLACLLLLTSATEVDNLNILLPELKQSQSSLPLQLITAHEGCYQWNSSYPEFLQVNAHQPSNTGCSRRAVISVAKLGSFSSTIYVSAIDGASEATLNIPVRIRKINKITIASKSRMMNIKQMQKLQLFGYDADANTFTSLEGLRFKWELLQDTQIIETVLIQNAHLYLPLRTRENLQKKGYQSDMLVVRALAPGNLKVRVTCTQTGYQTLTDQITISVHERFELKPGPIIHMATDTSFQLKLVRPNQQQIQLPQAHYRIISCRDFIVNQTLYLKVPNYPSKCTIRVEDTRTKPAYESSVQIIVQQANQLRIITDQLIIVGKESKYHVQLYKDGTPLFGQSSKIVYNSDFTLDTYAKTIVADRKGSGFLSAELGQLKKSVVINALLPVTVLLPDLYIHLPVGQYFKLRVLGGTGVYDYQISNDIVSINTMSILHARQIGQTNILIRDRSHSVNQIVVRVKISEISQIYSLQENKETNRDEWGHFYMIAQNSASQTFTQCQSAQFSLSVPTANLDVDHKVNFIQSVSFLQFHRSEKVQAAIAPTSLLKGKQFEIIDRYRQYVKQNEINSQDLKNYILSLQNYGICKALKFKSIVSFDQRALIALEGQTDVKTIIPLRVYDHIQTTIKNDESVFLMTPDSTLNWTYTGGSYRWATSPTRASVNGQVIAEGVYPLIRCPNRQTAPQNYQLKVFNQQTRSLLFPVSQTASISLVCKFPKKLHLGLQQGEIFDELYIQRQTEVRGIVKATDEQSQQFYNSSNVIYEFTSINGVINYRGRQFQYKSKGFNDTLSIYTYKLTNGLTYSRVLIQIDIYLVEPLVISHPMGTQERRMTIIALFTPKKPYVLYAKHIHSQLQIQCSDAVACQKGQNYIAVKLLRLGKGVVHIKDKKIYGSEDWHFQFVIVEPDEVRISGNKDYLQEGDYLQLYVTNYYNGQLVSPFTYQPSYLGVVLPANLKFVDQNVHTFRVRAEKAGYYQIEGESTYPRIRRSIQPWNVTVYKKISINIDDVTSRQEEGLHILQANTAIVVGCRRFLRIEGGTHELRSKVVSSDSGLTVNQLTQRNFQFSSNKQGLYSYTLQVYYKDNRIAVIQGRVNVNKIQKIQLQTIEQPVVGAHFRIHPKFKIGESNLEQMYCDYLYEWSTAAGLVKLGESLSFGLLDATSINATALKAGNDIITFQVKSKNGDLLIKETRNLQILEDFDLNLPTYIKRIKCETVPTSIIIAPNTRHVFDSQIKLKSDEGIVHVGLSSNILQSGKRLGHSTIRLSQPGYRSMHIEVEVKDIMGLFIQNQEGFINIEPNKQQQVQLYLQDNHGRLFYTPLQNLDIFVSSSNSDLVQVSLTAKGDSILLKSFKQGVCIIYVKVPSRNIFDAIAVSVGSAIIPGREVKITKNGIIRFSASSSQAHWTTDNKDILNIDASTGVARALRLGTTRVHYGQLSSTVSVLEIAKVEQVGKQKYKGSSVEVEYQLFWLVNNNYEQITNILSQGPINNNLDLSCAVDSRYLAARAYIIEKQGHQRLICSISLQYVDKWPESFNIKVKDASGLLTTKQFRYRFTPIFNIDKKHLTLSPHNTHTDIIIHSPSPVQVTLRNGKPKWVVSSTFDQKRKQQKIAIDMHGEQTDSTWYLDVSLQGQQQQIKVDYKLQGQQKKHQFWSYELDWPDYLIMLMAVVFFVICYMQYSSEQKYKNT